MLDKIRPEWDWKIARLFKESEKDVVDKIRPEWDWKRTSSAVLVHLFMIKSDQNGIESFSEDCFPYSQIEIKSDQNGIESTSGVLRMVYSLRR